MGKGKSNFGRKVVCSFVVHIAKDTPTFRACLGRGMQSLHSNFWLFMGGVILWCRDSFMWRVFYLIFNRYMSGFIVNLFIPWILQWGVWCLEREEKWGKIVRRRSSSGFQTKLGSFLAQGVFVYFHPHMEDETHGCWWQTKWRACGKRVNISISVAYCRHPYSIFTPFLGRHGLEVSPNFTVESSEK